MSRHNLDDPDGFGNPDVADELFSASTEIGKLRKEIREAKGKIHWLCKRVDTMKVSDYDRKVFESYYKYSRD